jgi:Tol biopolymer transport system component
MWAAAALLMANLLPAQTTEAARTLMQTAVKTEVVDGNLKSAIQQYSTIVAKYGKSDHGLAAQALLHMADCYRKMGDAEAHKIYERIVREFGDQTEAVAAARAHLGGSGDSRKEAATRRIWTATLGAELGYSSASADGRQFTYIVYRNRNSSSTVSNLFVHDLVTGASRQVTDAAAEDTGSAETYVEPEENAFSRNGKQLAYSWLRDKDNRYELRVVDVTGAGSPRFRRLFDSEEVGWIGPDDWSPDGKWIAVQLYRKNGPWQIGLVSVADGSLRVLKSGPDHRGARRLVFSPDGRYLAYDLPASENDFQRDIFVMPVDGGPEVVAVKNPADDDLMGWSPDGGRLIFASDRTGSMGLWSEAIAEGKPEGAAELLRRDIGLFLPMRLTSSGALLGAVYNQLGSSLRIADFDFEAVKFVSQPWDPAPEFAGTNSNPAWSPDGKSLAYLSLRPHHDFVLAIRSMETGKVQELHLNLRFVFRSDPTWSPDGRALAISATGLDERVGIYRVDVQSGAISPIALRPERHQFFGPAWSRDGKLYYGDIASGVSTGAAFMELDPSTGSKREVIRRASLGGVNLSPDGKFIATPTGSLDAAAKMASLLLISTSGNDVKEVMQVNQADWKGVWGWAPDSRSFLIRKGQGDLQEVWRVPVDGSAPQKTELKADTAFRYHHVNPNGRQVVFQVQETPKPPEVWITENFLPDAKGK